LGARQALAAAIAAWPGKKTFAKRTLSWFSLFRPHEPDDKLVAPLIKRDRPTIDLAGPIQATPHLG
jgi:hypothetical protein